MTLPPTRLAGELQPVGHRTPYLARLQPRTHKFRFLSPGVASARWPINKPINTGVIVTGVLEILRNLRKLRKFVVARSNSQDSHEHPRLRSASRGFYPYFLITQSGCMLRRTT